ncbi:response regulator [Achromobacter sp.]|uniref:response regulator n=1 Tax=Achromobacter sp. TaxID=134375 RepID=UPI0028B01C3B|nr:response regulator [Achromobacter sp.]
MRVLIVDDDDLSAQMTAECLMLDDFVSVKIARDSATALRLAREFAPEIIFLDVHLRDGSGLTLAPQLKNESRAPDMRIVILSGTARKDDVTEYPDGVNSWFEKPVPINTLLALVSRKNESE